MDASEFQQIADRVQTLHAQHDQPRAWRFERDNVRQSVSLVYGNSEAPEAFASAPLTGSVPGDTIDEKARNVYLQLIRLQESALRRRLDAR